MNRVGLTATVILILVSFVIASGEFAAFKVENRLNKNLIPEMNISNWRITCFDKKGHIVRNQLQKDNSVVFTNKQAKKIVYCENIFPRKALYHYNGKNDK